MGKISCPRNNMARLLAWNDVSQARPPFPTMSLNVLRHGVLQGKKPNRRTWLPICLKNCAPKRVSAFITCARLSAFPSRSLAQFVAEDNGGQVSFWRTRVKICPKNRAPKRGSAFLTCAKLSSLTSQSLAQLVVEDIGGHV